MAGVADSRAPSNRVASMSADEFHAVAEHIRAMVLTAEQRAESDRSVAQIVRGVERRWYVGGKLQRRPLEVRVAMARRLSTRPRAARRVRRAVTKLSATASAGSGSDGPPSPHERVSASRPGGAS